MQPTYRVTMSFTLDKLGVVYNITGSEPPIKYNGTGAISILAPGFVYKIDTITIYSKETPKKDLIKYKYGHQFYPPVTKTFNPIKSTNNYTMNLQYKKSKRAMIKGVIKLDAPVPHFVTIQIFEIDAFNNESLVGSSFSDECGNYNINFLIKDNYSYKLVAGYLRI